MSKLAPLTQAALAKAVAGAAPGCSRMFDNVRSRSVERRVDETKPFASVAGAGGTPLNAAADPPPMSRASVERRASSAFPPERSKRFDDVREGSTTTRIDGTNPSAPLTPRQVSAARLLVSGRTCRATAGELGVEEHTIYRWRKLPAFRAELDRQHRAFLAALAPRPVARRT